MAPTKRKPHESIARRKPVKRKTEGSAGSRKKIPRIIFWSITCLVAFNLVGMLVFLDEDDQPYSRLERQPTAEDKAPKTPKAKQKKSHNKLEKIDPKAALDDSWIKGMASGYDFDNNDGWDETASGIPLDNETYTVAVPQEDAHRLHALIEIIYEDTKLTAKVTDTGGFAKYNRDLDLSPAVWRAFGAATDDEWGVREVHYRYL